MEELKDIKAFDKAMNGKQEFIPLDKALKESAFFVMLDALVAKKIKR